MHQDKPKESLPPDLPGMTSQERQDKDRAILFLVRIHEILTRVGLYETAQLVHAAVQRSGFELAEQIVKAQRPK